MISEVFSKILSLLLELPPFVIVDQDQGAVHLRKGKLKRSLKPGLYWKIPFIDSVRKVCISEQTIDMPNQTVDNLDGETMTVSGYIRYRITDPASAILKLFDYDLSLPREAMKELATVVSSNHHMQRAKVEEAVEESLDLFIERGIDVIEFGLHDYAKTPVLRLIQN